MKLGESFRFADPGIDEHLWIVMSEPDPATGGVLVTSVTTWNEGVRDHSCIIEPGEHPSIRVRSCVFYDSTVVAPARELDARRERGELVMHEPLAPDLLRRVLAGAARTAFLTFDQLLMLQEQGLLDG
ncbi:MAG: hypothetical protein KIS87_08175 [Phycisphaeraceae bacterium]|nr:hypothetical protein [Phycisphaeraceae bacterium]